MKYIFVVGGVLSSLGKGIVASSTGLIFKKSGIKVFIQKLDPYLNYDSGTMSPYQHGEVFITRDGIEADLDLGHYERFTQTKVFKESSITSGVIYKELLDFERKGKFAGLSVQIIPHFTDVLEEKIINTAKKSKADITIIEIGGTIGDIESQPFFHTIKRMKMKNPNDVKLIFLSWIPFLKYSKEFKTKPTQHALNNLNSFGLDVDSIILRSDYKLKSDVVSKISSMTRISKKLIFEAPTLKSPYLLPNYLIKQNFHKTMFDMLDLKFKNINFNDWEKLSKKIESKFSKTATIGLVGKYMEYNDSYFSVTEALKHSGWKNEINVNIKFINSDKLTKTEIKNEITKCDGIIIPGGFGKRGTDNIVYAISVVRKQKIPMLGICLGLQLSIIEFARNICKIKDANTAEWSSTKNPLIHLLKGKSKNDNLGGTLRLGEQKFNVKKNTLAYEVYKKENVVERHRHRYEVNNAYLNTLKKHGMIFSGIYNKNIVEMIELPRNIHPYFIATQAHPEFTSSPLKTNPLFDNLLKKSIKK